MRFRISPRSLAGLCIALLSANPAMAQDGEAGHRLAERWCQGCHNVGRMQVPLRDTVPSFAAIARMPSATQTSLTAFLMTPHPTMPNYSLTRQEIRDVVAYILSLKEEKARPTETRTSLPAR
jgi:mono/diheme cytochrome c family protein